MRNKLNWNVRGNDQLEYAELPRNYTWSHFLRCKREQKQFIVFQNVYCFNKLQAFRLTQLWFCSVFHSHIDYSRFIGH